MAKRKGEIDLRFAQITTPSPS